MENDTFDDGIKPSVNHYGVNSNDTDAEPTGFETSVNNSYGDGGSDDESYMNDDNKRNGYWIIWLIVYILLSWGIGFGFSPWVACYIVFFIMVWVTCGNLKCCNPCACVKVSAAILAISGLAYGVFPIIYLAGLWNAAGLGGFASVLVYSGGPFIIPGLVALLACIDIVSPLLERKNNRVRVVCLFVMIPAGLMAYGTYADYALQVFTNILVTFIGYAGLAGLSLILFFLTFCMENIGKVSKILGLLMVLCALAVCGGTWWFWLQIFGIIGSLGGLQGAGFVLVILIMSGWFASPLMYLGLAISFCLE